MTSDEQNTESNVFLVRSANACVSLPTLDEEESLLMMAKNKKNERSKKNSARQSAESLCSENSSSSRTTSTAAVLVSSRISLSLSLLAPISYIKISPLAGSGSGCKGWLFGVSDSENFPHESVEHQQLNSANAKIEKFCCVCRIAPVWSLLETCATSS